MDSTRPTVPTDVLRLQVDPNRPDSIPAPGTWLNFGDCQIHVIAGPKAYGDFDHKTYGGGNLDHMAIRAVGFDAWKEHLTKHGVDYRQNNVRAMGQWQLFIRDPNGIVIELQFIVANEPAGSKGPDGSKTLHVRHVLIRTFPRQAGSRGARGEAQRLR
jgi:hypothetical protein